MERLQAQANFDPTAVEAEKRRIEEEKEAVIESIQNFEQQCGALDTQTADVRVRSVGVAEQLNVQVANRDQKLPETSCASLSLPHRLAVGSRQSAVALRHLLAY